MKFKCKRFEELRLDELYAILRLRSEIFVVEQDCIYQDLDNKDQKALHLMLITDAGQLIGYTRLFKTGQEHEEFSSIGRVVLDKTFRKGGLGKRLMEESISRIGKLTSNDSIKISAQCYLNKFYTELGFRNVGEPYLEDGIPHISMIFDF